MQFQVMHSLQIEGQDPCSWPKLAISIAQQCFSARPAITGRVHGYKNREHGPSTLVLVYELKTHHITAVYIRQLTQAIFSYYYDLLFTSTQTIYRLCSKIQKFQFVVISKQPSKNRVYLTITETSLGVRLNIAHTHAQRRSIVAQSVRLLPTHMHKDVHATRHCTVNDGLVK